MKKKEEVISAENKHIVQYRLNASINMIILGQPGRVACCIAVWSLQILPSKNRAVKGRIQMTLLRKETLKD